MTSWSATKPQGIAGVGSRPCVSMHTQMPTLHAQRLAFMTTPTFATPFAVKPGAGAAAEYGTGVSINRVERPEGPRGRAG